MKSRPPLITALALFFIFGTIMSGLTAVMLTFPGSALEPLWRLNPHAREGFVAMGGWAVLFMLIVCLACATAAVGLWRLTRIGYFTALTILCINLIGDTANALLFHDWRTLIGLPIAALMIAYLISKRRLFGSQTHPS